MSVRLPAAAPEAEGSGAEVEEAEESGDEVPGEIDEEKREEIGEEPFQAIRTGG